MLRTIASRIMPRTTIDIDGSVLQAAKRLARRSGRSLGAVVSELLAVALSDAERTKEEPRLEWKSQPMGALVDLEDKEAVNRILDES